MMCCRVGEFTKVCRRCGKFLGGMVKRVKKGCTDVDYVCNMLCFPFVPTPCQ